MKLEETATPAGVAAAPPVQPTVGMRGGAPFMQPGMLGSPMVANPAAGGVMPQRAFATSYSFGGTGAFAMTEGMRSFGSMQPMMYAPAGAMAPAAARFMAMAHPSHSASYGGSGSVGFDVNTAQPPDEPVELCALCGRGRKPGEDFRRVRRVHVHWARKLELCSKRRYLSEWSARRDYYTNIPSVRLEKHFKCFYHDQLVEAFGDVDAGKRCHKHCLHAFNFTVKVKFDVYAATTDKPGPPPDFVKYSKRDMPASELMPFESPSESSCDTPAPASPSDEADEEDDGAAGDADAAAAGEGGLHRSKRGTTSNGTRRAAAASAALAAAPAAPAAPAPAASAAAPGDSNAPMSKLKQLASILANHPDTL